MESFAKTLKLLIIGVVLIGLLVLAYYHVSNVKKASAAEDDSKMTPVKELLLRNLERDYPPTPKEVIKLYSEITKCYYNETYSDEELEQLAKKSMELFDDELLEENPWDDYFKNLKMEIADKKGQDCKIFNYNTSASTDVEMYKKDGREMASLYCTYTIRLGTGMSSTTELYVLRKDANNHWKILGWMVDQEGQ